MMAEAVSQQMVELGNGGVIDGGYVDDVCRRIRERWQDSVQAILDVGEMLIEARDGTKHGEWQWMFSEANPNRLPFSDAKARMLMIISRNEVLSNRNYSYDLPPSWRTLYELSKLPDSDLQQAIESGRIRPDMEQSEAIALKKELRREERDEIKGIDMPEDDAGASVGALEPGWWRVGSQYLYCGSNLDPEFLNGIPYARFAFADPPYNAGVDDWDSDFVWEQDWLQDKAEVVAVTPGGWNAFEFYRQTQMTYQWEMACWIRNGMTHGRCGFANWIKTSIFGKKPKIPQDFFDITIKTNETEETAHKGRKPYGYMSMMLDTFTDEGDNVIDPFAGSGTTLLVSEKMGRISYSAELSAEYCARIVERAKLIGCDHERL